MKKAMRSAARLTVLAMAAMLVALAVGAAPAQAKPPVENGPSGPFKNPYLTYDKNPDSPLNSKLTLSFNVKGKNYKSTVRAGSGDGTKNDCTKNKGWLPNGTYTNIPHYKKTWGNSVVQGYVWELGSKKCAAGTTTRTELFIHSNGKEGTEWDGKYGSNGCIKISQDSRKYFGEWWRGSPNSSKGSLKVIS